MRYRLNKVNNEELSVLGYGCMRFPRKGGKIDMAETERQLLRAIEGGINYFDTAYIYPGSEEALGDSLQKRVEGQGKNCHEAAPLSDEGYRRH